MNALAWTLIGIVALFFGFGILGPTIFWVLGFLLVFILLVKLGKAI